MTALLELRDRLTSFYSKNEMLIMPVVKFVLAFVTLLVINGEMGYMKKADNIAIVLIAALMCSFLPSGCMILIAALFTLVHMYALSLEIAIFGLVVYMLMFLLYFRFSPKDSLVVLLTPLLCFLKVPHVMPIAMGLLGTPASAVSVGCGVVVYYLLLAVTTNATAIGSVNAADATAKLRMVVDAMLGNKAMLVMLAAFVITVIVVYMVRRMSIDYSWTIAMAAGAILNLLILLVGDLVYETNISLLSSILGNIFALLIAKVIEFFRFCVDHSRTERVQFEDDEYYYYVKAVPKMTVSVPTKTVKRINTPTRGADYNTGRGSNGRTSSSGRASASGRQSGSGSRPVRTDRAPVSERISENSRRSMTISRRDEEDDDYEELF